MLGAWIVYVIVGVTPMPLYLCKTEKEARTYQMLLDNDDRSAVKFWRFGEEFGTR